MLLLLAFDMAVLVISCLVHVGPLASTMGETPSEKRATAAVAVGLVCDWPLLQTTPSRARSAAE